MNIPELEEVIEAVGAAREACQDCSCETDEPDYHAADCEGTIDVRLQVTEDEWGLHLGDASFDQDHRGHWGATTVAAEDDDSILDLAAQQLLDQVEESLAEEEAWV